jgi:hypothetical protein
VPSYIPGQIPKYIFPGCRTRTTENCDVLGEGSAFDTISSAAKKVFPAPPYNQDLGSGYVAHLSFQKVGANCICRNVHESASSIDSSELAKCHYWLRLGLGWYVYITTEGDEMYCVRYFLDEAIKEFNSRREGKVATAEEQEYLTMFR